MATETEVGKKVVELLNKSGLVRVWRQNTGRRGHVQLGRVGQADITGLIRGSGRRLEIEMKAAKGKQSEHQVAFETDIVGSGGVYLVMRTIQDAAEFLETL